MYKFQYTNISGELVIGLAEDREMALDAILTNFESINYSKDIKLFEKTENEFELVLHKRGHEVIYRKAKDIQLKLEQHEQFTDALTESIMRVFSCMSF